MKDLQLHPTPYGPPAAHRLHEVIATAKRRDPLRPVTVIVPTNSVGVATRRSLASDAWGPVSGAGRGIAGLSVLTVYRLGELLGAAALAADGRRPVSTPVITAAVRCVLADDPGVFAPVVQHPATEASLVEAHRELSACSSAALDRLAAAGRRSADVVRVHRRVREQLGDAWYDEADLMEAAVAAVHRGASVLDDVGEVVVHLPQDLAPAAGRVVAALAEATTVHVVVGLTGVAAADADVHRTLRRLGTATEPDLPHTVDVGSALVVDRVVSVSDAEEEVRTAVEQVLHAMDQGTPAERIAVVHPAPQPYATIVSEQFGAAGIAWNGPTDRTVTQRLAARWLLDVLDLPARAFARPAVLGVLAGLPSDRSRAGSLDAATAERLSRDAGIVDTVQGWIQRLTRLADEHRETAQRHQDVDDRQWLVDRSRRDADDADRLRGVVIDLAAELERAEQMATWRQLTQWLRDLLHAHLGTEHERLGWPDEERRAADQVEAAIDRIAALDAVEPTADVARLRRTLELELDSGLGRTGTIGQGVLVGRPSDTLGVDLDLVVVLGMSEGVFPRRPREDSLLAEHERELVADELPPRSSRVATQHRHLLAALAAARRRVLVHPRGDLRRSIERAPSRWLLDAVEATTGHRRLTDQDPSVVTVVASFADRVAHSDLPPDDQSFHLRTLAAQLPAAPGPSWLAPFDAGRQLLHARASDDFTTFDGNIAAVADLVRSPADMDGVASASALQAWIGCPHGYLLRHVLRVRPVEDPEERLEISPLDRGLLVHQVLEDWLAEQIDHGVPDPSTPWPDVARRRLFEIAHRRCAEWEDAGRTGHPQLWDVTRARLLREFAAFLDDDDQVRRHRGSRPVATELAFGPGAPYPELAIDLGDGRTVRFGGFIDRVDRTDDGGIVVTDYKAGSPRGYRELGPDNLVGDGSRLQLLLYGLAAHQAFDDAATVEAEYLFTREKDAGKRYGYTVDDDGAQVLTEVIRLVTDHIEAGVFPLRPTAPGWQLFTPCLYCDPDELGTADRYRDWERLRLLPDLRAYVAQVEPDVLDTAQVSP